MPPRKPQRPLMPAGVEAILSEMQNLQFGTMADAQRVMDRRMEEYNTTPQAELRGLSPDQVSQLMYGNWLDEGAMRLNARLSLGELEHASMLHNARQILRYVSDRGPLSLTKTGNLRRSAVAELLPELRIRPIERRILAGYKVIDELSVPTLYRMRGVLESLGMLRERASLELTPLGRDLLREESAGPLYAALFSVFFQFIQISAEPDLEYFEPFNAYAAVVLYQLSRHARDWTAEPVLYDRCWPADPGDPTPAGAVSINPGRGLSMRFQVLEPLVQFALLEADGELFGTGVTPPRYRVTPLFDRFVRFEFSTPPRHKKGVHTRRRR